VGKWGSAHVLIYILNHIYSTQLLPTGLNNPRFAHLPASALISTANLNRSPADIESRHRQWYDEDAL